MKKILTAAVLALLSTAIFAKDFQVYGPQGGLAMTVTLPEGFNHETDTCPMVILMHGIFASQRITPMPTIARTRTFAKKIIVC